MKSGTGSWRDIHSTVTGNDGRVTINSVLGNQVQFRAISEGSWERLASTSSEVEVKVDPILTLRGPAITYLSKVETFTAMLTPASESKTIILERFDAKKGAFVEVARTKVDSAGVATFTLQSTLGPTRSKATAATKSKSASLAPAAPVTIASSELPAFSSFRARLLTKDQSSGTAGDTQPLVSSTLWMTTLKP